MERIRKPFAKQLGERREEDVWVTGGGLAYTQTGSRMIMDAFAMAFGIWSATSSIYGFWDMIRYQVDVCHACGLYSLPFGFSVPWWWAGDLFVTMAFVGCGSFILGFIHLSRGRS